MPTETVPLCADEVINLLIICSAPVNILPAMVSQLESKEDFKICLKRPFLSKNMKIQASFKAQCLVCAGLVGCTGFGVYASLSNLLADVEMLSARSSDSESLYIRITSCAGAVSVFQ